MTAVSGVGGLDRRLVPAQACRPSPVAPILIVPALTFFRLQLRRCLWLPCSGQHPPPRGCSGTLQSANKHLRCTAVRPSSLSPSMSAWVCRMISTLVAVGRAPAMQTGGMWAAMCPRHCSTGASPSREPNWLPAVGSISAFRCALQPVVQVVVVCIAPYLVGSPPAATFSTSSHPAAAQRAWRRSMTAQSGK